MTCRSNDFIGFINNQDKYQNLENQVDHQHDFHDVMMYDGMLPA